MWEILKRLIRGPRPLSPKALKAFWQFSGKPIQDYWGLLTDKREFWINQLNGSPILLPARSEQIVGLYLTLYAHGWQVERIEADAGLVTWRWNSLRLTVRWGWAADEVPIKHNFIDKLFGGPFEGLRVLDIGAYIGDTALMFVQEGAAEVVAVEPSPINLPLLEKNIHQNQIQDRVRILPVAVSGENGTISFVIDDAHPDSHHLQFLTSSMLPLQGTWSNLREIQVPAWNLEKIIQYAGWQEVDVAKVDCEGGEYPLFLQTSAEVLRKVKTYIVEYHDGIDPLKKRLEGIGYKVEEKPWPSPHPQMGLFYAYRISEE